MMRLKTIADILHVACLQDAPINSIVIDSRKVTAGSLFIALPGEHFDGHEFAHDAEAKGASAIICTMPVENLVIPQLLVNDAILALGEIARYHRSQYTLPVIALTGSNGKTSVKEMIHAILPEPSLATKGNLNNHIGAPLSVLDLDETHLAAVFELGANHVGEIAYTANIVRPDVALINNIAPAHIGEFGSIEAIAKAKGEIFSALPTSGTAVINDDDAYAHFWDEQLRSSSASHSDCRQPGSAHEKDRSLVARNQETGPISLKILRFSQTHQTDVYANNIILNPQGFATFDLHLPDTPSMQITLQVPGRHNVSNALAAAACCYAINLSPTQIYHGLSQFSGVAGRLTFRKGVQETLIIDDTYNANLKSVLAAIEVLAEQPGYKILVLGNMGELGEYTLPHHGEIGKVAKKMKIDALFTYGEFAKESGLQFGQGATHYESKPDLISCLHTKLTPGATVLVKGSRSAAMEQVVTALLQQK